MVGSCGVGWSTFGRLSVGLEGGELRVGGNLEPRLLHLTSAVNYPGSIISYFVLTNLRLHTNAY
jgi:hypothetical protein